MAGVLGPALHDRELVQRRVVGLYDFLTRPRTHFLGTDSADLDDLTERAELAEQTLGRRPERQRQKPVDPPFKVRPRVDAQRPTRAFAGAEDVDDQRDIEPAHVFEEQRRASGLHDPVGYLGDLQVPVDGSRDAL